MRDADGPKRFARQRRQYRKTCQYNGCASLSSQHPCYIQSIRPGAGLVEFVQIDPAIQPLFFTICE